MDNSPTRSTSADPNTATSSPAQNSTDTGKDYKPSVPGAPPTYLTEDDGSTYTNLTIDDFDPVVVGSEGHWLTPLTDSDMSAVRPGDDRSWHLGTYKRTETKNATLKIGFWGSEISLYGDRGPTYGAYSLTLDDETPVVESAFYPALATGDAGWLYTFRNLTDEYHELVITNLGTREGLLEGESFLFDYALVKQRVGLKGLPSPINIDIAGADLEKLNETGVWSLNTVELDGSDGNGGFAPEATTIYSTAERGASIAHTFSGTGIGVYGTRNGSHGLYRTTLTSLNTSSVVHDETYNATVQCGLPVPSIFPGCEWHGSVLLYSIANLDPEQRYEIKLENMQERPERAPIGASLDIEFIRVFQTVLSSGAEPGGSNGSSPSLGGGGGGSGNNNSTNTNGARSLLHAEYGMANFVIFVIFGMMMARVWRS